MDSISACKLWILQPVSLHSDFRASTCSSCGLSLLLTHCASCTHTHANAQIHIPSEMLFRKQTTSTPEWAWHSHLALQVVVGFSPVPLRHLLPVVPNIGQDLIKTGFDGSIRFIYLTSCHLVVQDSHILSGGNEEEAFSKAGRMEGSNKWQCLGEPARGFAPGGAARTSCSPSAAPVPPLSNWHRRSPCRVS